jgi:hypothetical protein
VEDIPPAAEPVGPRDGASRSEGITPNVVSSITPEWRSLLAVVDLAMHVARPTRHGLAPSNEPFRPRMLH